MIILTLGLLAGAAFADDALVREELANAVASVAGVAVADVDIVALGADFSQCVDPQRVEVSVPAQQTLRNQVKADIWVSAGHGTCMDVSVMATIEIYDWVAVAGYDADAGAPVELVSARVPRSALRGDSVPLESKVLARRDVAAGEPATWANVWPAPDLVKGQMLTIELEGDGLHVSMPALALTSGQIGDTVRVRNLVSNWTIDAVLVAPDRAVPVRK
jgi:flagella basal body P-ring formation protein FlgA